MKPPDRISQEVLPKLQARFPLVGEEVIKFFMSKEYFPGTGPGELVFFVSSDLERLSQ